MQSPSAATAGVQAFESACGLEGALAGRGATVAGAGSACGSDGAEPAGAALVWVTPEPTLEGAGATVDVRD